MTTAPSVLTINAGSSSLKCALFTFETEPRPLARETIDGRALSCVPGLSYAFLLSALERIAGPDAAAGRVILAHLGNGSSLAPSRSGEASTRRWHLHRSAGS